MACQSPRLYSGIYWSSEKVGRENYLANGNLPLIIRGTWHVLQKLCIVSTFSLIPVHAAALAALNPLAAGQALWDQMRIFWIEILRLDWMVERHGILIYISNNDVWHVGQPFNRRSVPVAFISSFPFWMKATRCSPKSANINFLDIATAGMGQ
jgi:hypothetical protein